ncbi:hypothetical protein [Streptomyces sp. NBC_00046]|uniref:hypothetical protein n=1 Tax=unclassified Streptomyces TaxID=2593676 RepID=UPI003243BC5A
MSSKLSIAGTCLAGTKVHTSVLAWRCMVSRRRRAGQHLHRRSRCVRLRGAVALGEIPDQRLDPVQRRPAGFEERSEREDGRGGPVPDGVLGIRPRGTGEPAFDQRVEGARRPGAAHRARERGRFAVGTVHEQAVDRVLVRSEAEQGQQGRVHRVGRLDGIGTPGLSAPRLGTRHRPHLFLPPRWPGRIIQ